MTSERPDRIVKIELDQASLAAATADAEHERRVAIFDLLQANQFQLADDASGPYHVYLSTAENRLVFDVRDREDVAVRAVMLSLTPFRRVIRDYFRLCESYYDAIRSAPPEKIEAIDMARRSLHNEGSQVLIDRLESKAEIDFDTARRLFTLICALHRPR